MKSKQTTFAFTEWDKFELGKICNIMTGKLNSNAAEGFGAYPFFTCSKENYKINSYSFDCEAILLAGNNAVGDFGIKHYKGKFDAYQRTYVITIKNENEFDYSFLFYSLKSKLDDFRRNSFGTATQYLTKTILDPLTIMAPQIHIQQKIGKTLHDLDNKIQNLQNQNRILEQTAQAIFKSWFVDFDGVTEFEDSELGKIPKGWKVDSIFNCANYINGSAFRNQDSSSSRTGLPVIKITELKFGITSNTLFTEKNMDSKYHLHNNDLLFAWSGSPDTSIDTFIWTGGDAILNQHIHKINLDNIKEKPFIYFLFKYFKKIFIEIARNKQTTGLGHVTLDDMKNLLVVLPNEKFMEYAYKNLNPIFNTICNNIYESQSLTQTRDTLLPKLMSGEIRV